MVYIHVAADWADIFDTPTKQEKTYLKPRCTPFPGNMSFNPETVAKRWAPVWAWMCPWSHWPTTQQQITETQRKQYSSLKLKSCFNILFSLYIDWYKTFQSLHKDFIISFLLYSPKLGSSLKATIVCLYELYVIIQYMRLQDWYMMLLSLYIIIQKLRF